MNRNDIKNLRKTLGLSQQELGEKVGVDRNTISSWERGLNLPRGKLAGNLQAIFDDSPPLTDYENEQRKKRIRETEEEQQKLLAQNIKALSRTFTEGQCYTISESRLAEDGDINQQPILRYERKEGIHHVFREIRGKWIVTYTNAQLIGKYIKEVDIQDNGSP